MHACRKEHAITTSNVTKAYQRKHHTVKKRLHSTHTQQVVCVTQQSQSLSPRVLDCTLNGTWHGEDFWAYATQLCCNGVTASRNCQICYTSTSRYDSMVHRRTSRTERRLPFQTISHTAFLNDMPAQLKQWPSQPPNGCVSKHPASMANTTVKPYGY